MADLFIFIGLRLPYGERTGDRAVDAVMLTAHDKFADILAEAQKGDSMVNHRSFSYSNTTGSGPF